MSKFDKNYTMSYNILPNVVVGQWLCPAANGKSEFQMLWSSYGVYAVAMAQCAHWGEQGYYTHFVMITKKVATLYYMHA